MQVLAILKVKGLGVEREAYVMWLARTGPRLLGARVGDLRGMGTEERKNSPYRDPDCHTLGGITDTRSDPSLKPNSQTLGANSCTGGDPTEGTRGQTIFTI